jgi:hypothetical protein
MPPVLRRTLLAAVVGAVALLVLVAPSTAGHHAGHHNYPHGGYWPKIVFENNTDGTWSIAQSSNQWGAGTWYLMTQVIGGDGCNGSFGVVEICSGTFPEIWCGPNYPPGSWSGCWEPRWMGCDGFGNHACGGLIRLSNPATAQGLRRSVSCHEMGHALGLNHLSGVGSCMDGGNVFPSYPHQHDYDVLNVVQYTEHHPFTNPGGGGGDCKAAPRNPVAAEIEAVAADRLNLLSQLTFVPLPPDASETTPSSDERDGSAGSPGPTPPC